METQKMVNLLNGSDKKSCKFATRKLKSINDRNNGQYSERRVKMIELLTLNKSH